MDDVLLELLEKLAKFGEDNDTRETERPKRSSTSRAIRGACSGSSSAPLMPPGSWRSVPPTPSPPSGWPTPHARQAAASPRLNSIPRRSPWLGPI